MPYWHKNVNNLLINLFIFTMLNLDHIFAVYILSETLSAPVKRHELEQLN